MPALYIKHQHTNLCHILQSKTVHFKSDSNTPLIGCGIDVETIDRFSSYTGQDNPLPMVFTTNEINHIHTLSDHAAGFCASFSCKEAVYKALGQPINFIECELFYTPLKTLHHPTLTLRGDNALTICDCTVRFLQPQPDEMVAIVHIYGRRSTWPDPLSS